MRSASTEKELGWLRVDYQAKNSEFEFVENQKEAAHHEAQSLVDLYQTLYKLYVDLFKEYFQEVYDAEMQEVLTDPFDDSPAGFRLLYKHGRIHTSSWTYIRNENEYVDALVSFLVATETQIAQLLTDKKIERDLAEVITAVINHVRSREFLESAMHRMASVHGVPTTKNPLENLDSLQKKPWVYTSGGRMDSLVAGYFSLNENICEATKWIESEMELLIFIIDTLKGIPQSSLKGFFEGRCTSLLMHSPTHAFLLKPLLSPLKELWMNDYFTYTHVRDHFLIPSEMFVKSMLIDDEMIEYLLKRLSEKLHESLIPRLIQTSKYITGPLNPIFFREQLLEIISEDRILSSVPLLSSTEIDSILYAQLPLFREKDLKTRVKNVLSLLPDMDSDRLALAMHWFDKIYTHKVPIFGAQELIEICKSLLLFVFQDLSQPTDFHLKVVEATQSLSYSMPKPLIFADTNWTKDMFAFLVNPGTAKLDLWKLDYTGIHATPMTNWKMWLDGSHKESVWGIYNKPVQYNQC